MRLDPLDAPTPGLTYADASQTVCDAFTRADGGEWAVGEAVHAYLRSGSDVPQVKSKRDAARARREVFRRLAGDAGVSANCIAQHHDCYEAFCVEGVPAENRRWSWHRSLLAAARRTKQRVADLLDEALAKDWHIADLNSLGRRETAVRRLVAVCACCGAKVRVDAPRGTVAYDSTEAICCPVCPQHAAMAMGTLQ